MIAIAGSIGTGLFLGSGGALATDGPVGMWLAYAIMGALVGIMMMSLVSSNTHASLTGRAKCEQGIDLV